MKYLIVYLLINTFYAGKYWESDGHKIESIGDFIRACIAIAFLCLLFLPIRVYEITKNIPAYLDGVISFLQVKLIIQLIKGELDNSPDWRIENWEQFERIWTDGRGKTLKVKYSLWLLKQIWKRPQVNRKKA